MSEFYGALEGSRGPTTRAGTKASGIKAVAQSWEGSVATYLYKNEAGETCARITAGKGSTFNPFDRVIFSGTLADLLAGKEGWS